MTRSCLSRIVLDTYGDEGEAVEEYREEHPGLDFGKHFKPFNGFSLYCQLHNQEWETCDRFPEFDYGEEHFWTSREWAWVLHEWKSESP
jgi:hypothetical protein